LLLLKSGSGRILIDSRPFQCEPGTLLWTRPNQVVQCFPEPGVDADVVLFTETFPLRMNQHIGMLDDVLRPSHWQLTDAEMGLFQQVFGLLRDEFERPDRGLGEQLLRHLLAVVLLHVDQMCRDHHQDPTGAKHYNTESRELFLGFRQELERSYRATRLVEDYAAALNCTARTLSRACRAVAGTSAKDVIDARVALEARRMLAHTDLPVGSIARQLGFTEVTNFGKFFARRVNMTPGAFRRESKTD
jgi:AraC-like DNA-binding protein